MHGGGEAALLGCCPLAFPHRGLLAPLATAITIAIATTLQLLHWPGAVSKETLVCVCVCVCQSQGMKLERKRLGKLSQDNCQDAS